MPFDSMVVVVIAALIIGLCIGSFLNVVIHRLPKMMEREWHEQCAELHGNVLAPTPQLNLVKPRSRCPSCGHQITALENIPLISYLFLRGRCAKCGVAISPRYPFVELLTGLVSAVVAWHFGFSWTALGALILVWSLIALAAIDFDTQLLPDSITLPLLWTGLAFNLNGAMTDLSSAVTGAMIGYLALWSVFWAFKLTTGKEGMGYGDFKLLAALGAWLGWQMLPVIVLLSSIVGAIVGIALIVFARHGRNNPIPFGPYLAAAGIIALLWGQELTKTYLGLLG
jgi:leader peptidase (prepilin peptidase)/N-methyltransferase